MALFMSLLRTKCYVCATVDLETKNFLPFLRKSVFFREGVHLGASVCVCQFGQNAFINALKDGKSCHCYV